MGPLKHKVVHRNDITAQHPAESVLILGEEDVRMDNGKYNYWETKTIGQGFVLRIDYCKRLIVGCKIKNKGKGGPGDSSNWATDEFRVSGSVNETGPWKTLVESHLADTRGVNAPLVNFTFVEPVEIQYIKFELVSFWGDRGGGLQYFAAIPATSKCLPFGIVDLK